MLNRLLARGRRRPGRDRAGARGRPAQGQHAALPAAAAARRARSTPGPPSPAPSTSTRATASSRTPTPSPPPARVPDLPRARSTATASPTARSSGPTWPARDAQTLTLFGLHLPARLFAGATTRRRRSRTSRCPHAGVAELGAGRADPGRAARDAGRQALPRGAHAGRARGRPRRCPAATSSTGRCSGRGPSGPSEVGTWGVETRPRPGARRGAGARRGGGVSGIPGHNAAQAVLAGCSRRALVARIVRNTTRAGSTHGPSAGVRAPHDRGARHPLRPAVVHRRARHAQVGGRRPGRARGRVRRGHRLRRSAIEGFARVYEADMLAKPDPATFQVLPWRGEQPGHRADVLRHHAARRLAELRRPAPRAASARSAKAGRPRASPSTPTPRSSSTCSSRAATPGERARAGRPGRLLRPRAARHRPRLPPRRDHHARVDGHLGRVQPPRGRARARTRSTCATPTRSPRPTTS